MFNVPLSLTTESAFELPSYLHESGAHNPWVDANLHGRDVHSFLEGPCFDADGRLWLVDIPFGRIFRVTPTGEWDLIVKYDGWPNGLKFHPDGRLIIADYRHGLLAMDVESRRISPLVTHFISSRFIGVNDLTFSSAGDLYFTDQGQSGLHDACGAVYRLKADGTLQQLLDGIPSPNGLVLSPDENFLFLAVTRDNAVWRVPLVEGGVSKVGKFIQLSGGTGPDGLAIDSDGNLYVAHHGLGCVWQFDKRGEARYRIDSSRGDWTTNVTVHPHHPNELFITESQTGTVLKATLPLY
ncbi:MAG: SMP-30/gluconolactonase/LRE family protein [Betaproteobacteria bacterium]|nr:SMP-30/gluconolactonase/LRE family protein [Betaproteobacteria bacterium]